MSKHVKSEAELEELDRRSHAFTRFRIPVYDNIYMFFLHFALLVQLGYISDPQCPWSWHAFGWVLESLFLLDMVTKYSVYGRRGLGKSSLTRISETSINFLSLVCMIYLLEERGGVYGTENKNLVTSPGLSLTLVIQSLRFFRMFFLINDQQVFEDIFPTLFRALFILFSVIYFFSVFAHTFFCTSLRVTEATMDADDDSPNYAPLAVLLNFSSMLQSLFTMFELAVLSNWSVIMDAAQKQAGDRAYFFFYIYLRIF